MNAVKVAAIVLIVAGVLGLVFGSFSYTTDTHEAKLGPLEVSVKDKETVNIPVWAGVGAIVIGGVLLLVGAKRGESRHHTQPNGEMREAAPFQSTPVARIEQRTTTKSVKLFFQRRQTCQSKEQTRWIRRGERRRSTWQRSPSSCSPPERD